MEVSISPDLQIKLTNLAVAQGRKAESLVQEAIERLIDHDEWFISELDKGLAQIEQGQVLSHDDVGERLERLLTKKRSRA